MRQRSQAGRQRRHQWGGDGGPGRQRAGRRPTGGGQTGGSGPTGGGQTGGTGGAPPAPMFGTPAGRVEDGPFECPATAASGAITFEKIAEWRDDATAAYTMIHDDMCGPELRGIDRIAMPALEMRNLTATMGPFVQVCQEANLWDMVRGAQAKGHEIANHSFTHLNIRMDNAGKEVMMAKMVFDMQLMKPVTFYVFPYDDFSAPTVDMVKMAGHIGARAGVRDDNDGFDNPPINLATPENDMELEFDAWPRAYSKYASFAENRILDLHVYNAIDKKGFAVREFHSITTRDKSNVAGEGFGPVPLRIYEAHLDFLWKAWKANKVWTSTASTIIRYRHARTACKASVNGTNIVFDTSAAECTQYATPISVIVTTAMDVPGLKAIQGGKAVPVRKLAASRFSITADPTAGNVELGGCSTAPPTVDPTLQLDPRPMPANSVCDLESLKGVGMPGRMDDLERPPTLLQVLPNPSQGDDRNGSWSWYPQSATAEIVPDGMNRALKYTGTMPGGLVGRLAGLHRRQRGGLLLRRQRVQGHPVQDQGDGQRPQRHPAERQGHRQPGDRRDPGSEVRRRSAGRGRPLQLHHPHHRGLGPRHHPLGDVHQAHLGRLGHLHRAGQGEAAGHRLGRLRQDRQLRHLPRRHRAGSVAGARG